MHDNPMGLDGFAFVEFTGPDPEALAVLFLAMGFAHVANHRSKNVRRYAQGDINFLLNMEPAGQVGAFRAEHGPSANAMAFRVADGAGALKLAVERGATAVTSHAGPGELNLPGIEGIGGSHLYLVDERGGASVWDIDFEPVPAAGVDDHSVGLHTLDHLTHNVNRGRMAHWAGFYEKIFNFRQIRYFDIEGQSTGLFSKAMTAPDDKIRIPQRKPGRAQPDRGIPARLQRRGDPAHCARDRRYLRDGRCAAGERGPLPGHQQRLFRPDRQAAPGTRS
jgi:4-hydroxyphenylpyruvate dioxygenase